MKTRPMKTHSLARSLAVASLVTIGLVLLASPALAGLYYEAKTTVDKGQGSSEVHSWIDGEKARIEFRDSDIPTVDKDNYLITHDGGQTFFMVNPKEKTVMEWDLAAAMNMLEGFSGLVDFEISDPQVEKLDDKDGGSVLGKSTRYVRYETSYQMNIKVLGMKRKSTVATDQEMWLTNDYSENGLGAWLRKDRPTGNDDFDRLLNTEMAKVEGFPLKTVTVTTTTDRRGREQTSRSVTEVTVLREESVSADRFEIPSDYEKVDMFGGDGEGSSNPLKGLFGRRGDG